MRSVVRRDSSRIAVLAAVTVLVSALLGGCSAAGPSSAAAAGSYPSYSYTCCATDLGAAAWHPGQTLRLTWTAVREAGRTGSSQAGVTLTVVLTGPYRSVRALKSSIGAGLPSAEWPGGRAPIAVAPAIRATTRAGGAPVSVLVIPRNAALGFYNVQFVVTSGGGSVKGSTIIRVTR